MNHTAYCDKRIIRVLRKNSDTIHVVSLLFGLIVEGIDYSFRFEHQIITLNFSGSELGSKSVIEEGQALGFLGPTCPKNECWSGTKYWEESQDDITFLGREPYFIPLPCKKKKKMSSRAAAETAFSVSGIVGWRIAHAAQSNSARSFRPGGIPIFERTLCKALNKTPLSAHTSPKDPLKFCSVTHTPLCHPGSLMTPYFLYFFDKKNNKFVHRIHCFFFFFFFFFTNFHEAHILFWISSPNDPFFV